MKKCIVLLFVILTIIQCSIISNATFSNDITLTSNNSNGFLITSSTPYGDGAYPYLEAWNSFSSTTDVFNFFQSQSPTGFLTIKYPAPVNCTGIRWTQYGSPHWVLTYRAYYSHNGINWTAMSTKIAVQDTNEQGYTWASVSAQYWRFYSLTTATDYFTVGHIEFITDYALPTPTPTPTPTSTPIETPTPTTTIVPTLPPVDTGISWLDDLFNAIINFLKDVISSLLLILPDSPFNALDNSPIAEYLPSLNWFIPLSSMVGVLEIWLSCVLVYYLLMVIMRWVKLIE